jgi:hypothetical protein
VKNENKYQQGKATYTERSPQDNQAGHPNGTKLKWGEDTRAGKGGEAYVINRMMRI